MQYSSVVINGKQLGTHGNRTRSSSIVMAKWDNSLFGSCNSTVSRAAKIDHFCKHAVTIAGETKTILLASLSWFKSHPKNTKPIIVWYNDLFEADGIHSFVPVQSIMCK